MADICGLRVNILYINATSSLKKSAKIKPKEKTNKKKTATTATTTRKKQTKQKKKKKKKKKKKQRFPQTSNIRKTSFC